MMLKIKNVHAKLADLDQVILRGVDLTVNAGEIHVILGPNGSGKSSLGRVLLGDEKYDVTDGEAVLEGENLFEMESDERARAGFFLSFQSPPEVEGVSTEELLIAAKKAQTGEAIGAYKFGKTLKEQLRTMHLSDAFVDREMHVGASGGERRKLEMASLLTLNPKVAFLDEIDSGIDVDGLQATAAALNEWVANGDKSLIIISHGKALLDLVKPTHVHILVRGKMVKSGGTELLETVHADGFRAFTAARNLNVKTA